MPRRREVPKRTILPDPKFGDQTIAKFINVMMQDGKKSIAERVLYGALDTIGSRGASEPLDVFYQALENVRRQPDTELKQSVPIAPRDGLVLHGSGALYYQRGQRPSAHTRGRQRPRPG